MCWNFDQLGNSFDHLSNYRILVAEKWGVVALSLRWFMHAMPL
jgi:hypothetical protein